ncbi:hypothetical protein N7492_003382 [Penicillium capsulatum]|uniref:Uncharacterized protein n=1 Tax=Penicillium capsulatum TaxID=69766 RepID=A0A9W9LXC1_9EURO|nr:hypothetical protein N7492_003382 [Penicillium capsulatum]KAJ6122035.1 hypothetical protein N7512_004500 [Penicillium capsulatum]
MAELIEKAKDAVTNHFQAPPDSSTINPSGRGQCNSKNNPGHYQPAPTTVSQDTPSGSANIPYTQEDMTSDTFDRGDLDIGSPDEQDIVPGTDHHAIHGGRSGKQDTLF